MADDDDAAIAAAYRERMTAERTLTAADEATIAALLVDHGTCGHCGRPIVKEGGRWIDPAATGDDSVWRETCDAHDTFTAEHEPEHVHVWGPFQRSRISGTLHRPCTADPGCRIVSLDSDNDYDEE